MESLGSRIRTIRKQKKLTLATLAGEHITKGMLSLIENDKANPSMDTLQYLAERLQVDVSSLLEEVPITELRELSEKVKKIYDNNVEFEKAPYQEIITLIEPYLEKLPACYESGKLLFYYTGAQSHLKMNNWEPTLERGLKMFKEINMMNEWVRFQILHFSIYFYEHQYEQALNIAIATEAEVKREHYIIDTITTLDLLYIIGISYLAINEQKKGMNYIEQALQLSKEKRLFYKIEDIFRVACFQAMIDNDDAAREYYIKKIEQYAAFTEDKLSFLYTIIIQLHYYNSFTHDYEKALEYLGHDREIEDTNEDLALFYCFEKGKTLYHLGQFDEALVTFEKLKEIPNSIHHPYDLSMLAEKYSYKSLCYEQKGQLSKALEEAKKAVDIVDPLIDTPYKQFINKTYASLCKKVDQL